MDTKAYILVVVVIVLLGSNVIFAMLWLSGRESDSSAESLIDAASEVQTPSQGVRWSGGDDRLEADIEIPGDDQLSWMEDYLEVVDLPVATVDRMGQTRTLDGTQAAEGDRVRVTWTYHPDDGLSAVFIVE